MIYSFVSHLHRWLFTAGAPRLTIGTAHEAFWREVSTR